jgi:hypothetical protein
VPKKIIHDSFDSMFDEKNGKNIQKAACFKKASLSTSDSNNFRKVLRAVYATCNANVKSNGETTNNDIWNNKKYIFI